VVDVDCAVGSAPCLTAAADGGYQIDEAEIAYWGRCPDCLAQGRAPSPSHAPDATTPTAVEAPRQRTRRPVSGS
jgi:Fur family ferric uptake transcriptional regulator